MSDSILDSDLPRLRRDSQTAVNSILSWTGFPVMGLVPPALEIKTRALKAPEHLSVLVLPTERDRQAALKAHTIC